MKIRSIFFLLMSSFLTSCIAVVVAGATASLVVYDKRTINALEKDARLFHQIHKAIVTDPRFSHSRIVVTSFNQIILLVGQAPAASLRVLAEKIAQNTPNVKRVYDEIAINFPLTLTKQAEDSWITSQVRSLMLAEKGLKSGSIRVITENGLVYLMGIVTHDQADLAVNVARKINGVQKVIKVFQYRV